MNLLGYQMALGGLLSMGGYMGTQTIRGEEITGWGVLSSFALGAMLNASNGASYGKTKYITSIEKQSLKIMSKKGIISGLKHYGKHIGTKIWKDFGKTAIRNAVITIGKDVISYWGSEAYNAVYA